MNDIETQESGKVDLSVRPRVYCTIVPSREKSNIDYLRTIEGGRP